MTKNEIKQFLKGFGWEEDRWGRLQLSSSSRNPQDARVRQYRMKFQDRSVRFEVRTIDTDRPTWIKLTGDFYSKCKILPDGRLRIGSYLCGKGRQNEQK